MANEEHLKILKQGVEVWNEWRRRNPEVQPKLNGADLSGATLFGANLLGANLRGAALSMAVFSAANLRGADLQWAIVGWTTFGDVDLSSVKGLETVQHEGPSTIGIDTIYRSGGNIPEAFLRGAGVPDTFITYIRSLGGTAIEFYSAFISYSSKDEELARRLYNDLQGNNVRCWLAPEDLKIGTRIRMGLEEAVRLHDKLLLILSKDSLGSRWVRHEVETALQKEFDSGNDILFPVRVDEAIFDVKGDWADHLRTRNIGDFRQWKEHDAY